jgi:hypothetical protein
MSEPMSRQDHVTACFERCAREMGIAATCCRMQRPGFELDGEWFPPYEDYEARANGKFVTFDSEAVERLNGPMLEGLLEQFARGLS